MKLEYSSVEVMAALRRGIQDNFPDYKIDNINLTSYGALQVDLTILEDKEARRDLPASSPTEAINPPNAYHKPISDADYPL